MGMSDNAWKALSSRLVLQCLTDYKGADHGRMQGDYETYPPTLWGFISNATQKLHMVVRHRAADIP